VFSFEGYQIQQNETWTYSLIYPTGNSNTSVEYTKYDDNKSMFYKMQKIHTYLESRFQEQSFNQLYQKLTK